jgi:hypothetical protein
MKINKAISAQLVALPVVTAALLGSASAGASNGGGASYSDASTSSWGSSGGSNLPMLAPGVQELGLAGALNWRDDTTYNLQISYGRFFTDNWLLGVRGGFQGEDSDVDFNVGVFAEYNWLTGTQWVPFFGVGADWAEVNSDFFDADSIELGATLGVKYFFRPNIAVSASLSAAWIADDLPSGDDFNRQLDLGLRFYF